MTRTEELRHRVLHSYGRISLERAVEVVSPVDALIKAVQNEFIEKAYASGEKLPHGDGGDPQL